MFLDSCRYIRGELTDEEADRISPLTQRRTNGELQFPGIIRNGDIYLMSDRSRFQQGFGALRQLIAAINAPRFCGDYHPKYELIMPRSRRPLLKVQGFDCEWTGDYGDNKLLHVTNALHVGAYVSTHCTMFYWRWNPIEHQLQVVGLFSRQFRKQIKLLLRSMVDYSRV